jgi:hypothetical protein
MKTKFYRAFILIFVASALVFFAGLSCKKAEERAPAEAVPEGGMIGGNAKSLEIDARAPGKTRSGSDGSFGKEQGLAEYFLTPMELARTRLLEYRVELTYESKDLGQSRRRLLAVAGKFGFINKSHASVDDGSPVSVSEIFVKADRLYEALQDFDATGVLVTENMTVTDLTEEMLLRERSVKREQLRIARRNVAAAQIAPGAKNWNDIENSLAQSEDRLDASEHAKWKIRDRVAWALVRVTIKVPELPERITVPRYTDALIGMVNLLLKLMYAIVYMLPLAAIAALLVWKKKQLATIFRSIFRMKKKED